MAAIYSKYDDKSPNGARKLVEVRPEILKKRFLELYMEVGIIRKTCDIIGMVPRTVHHWKVNDPDFKAALEEAEKVILMMVQDEAIRRAYHGVERPVYQGGKLVGFVKEYSDSLLQFIIKAKDPRYRDRVTNEHVGADGKPIQHQLAIHHVHSSVPLANNEDSIDNTPYLESTKQKPLLPENTNTSVPSHIEEPEKIPVYEDPEDRYYDDLSNDPLLQ